MFTRKRQRRIFCFISKFEPKLYFVNTIWHCNIILTFYRVKLYNFPILIMQILIIVICIFNHKFCRSEFRSKRLFKVSRYFNIFCWHFKCRISQCAVCECHITGFTGPSGENAIFFGSCCY